MPLGTVYEKTNIALEMLCKCYRKYLPDQSRIASVSCIQGTKQTKPSQNRQLEILMRHPRNAVLGISSLLQKRRNYSFKFKLLLMMMSYNNAQGNK